MKLLAFFLVVFLPSFSVAQEGDFPKEPPPSYKDYFNPERDLPQNLLPDSRFADEFIKMLFILAGIVCFLFLLLWFVKKATVSRTMQVSPKSKIKIIDQRLLSVRSSVFLLDIEGCSYIAIDSQQGTSIIAASKPILPK